MIILVAAVELITLHLVDGRAVQVNPKAVTTLQEARDENDQHKQLTDKVKCVVRLTDGMYVSVAEDCDMVRQFMQGEDK